MENVWVSMTTVKRYLHVVADEDTHSNVGYSDAFENKHENQK